MIKFFAINSSTGRVEGFYSEAMRDDFVSHGYGHAVTRGEAKGIMRDYVLNFAASIACDLTRKVKAACVSTPQSAQATARLYCYYENPDQLIIDFTK